jgi:hypothetical protein
MGRTASVDLAKLHGPATVRWFDPASGELKVIDGSPFPNSGTREFATPGKNAAGENDWVLVLEAR